MKIIILGGRRACASVAEILSREENEITVVDRSREILNTMQCYRMDINTCQARHNMPYGILGFMPIAQVISDYSHPDQFVN